MSAGKEKCELLRRIRKDVAERYGLHYSPSECKHQGDCSGTCPKCDEELKELQSQLESRGIKDIDLTNITIESIDNDDVRPIEGDIAVSSIDDHLIGKPAPLLPPSGIPAPPYFYKEKKRVLYKEVQIAGILYRGLRDRWNELYEGVELALVREKYNKYDNYAIAVALADDYDGDPEDFDFNCSLGYVPRAENQYLATMMDLGWSDAFECELSQVNGSNPSQGSLYIKIYMVSKEDV